MFINFFSSYTDQQEKNIDVFLSNLSSGSNKAKVRLKIRELLQKDIIRTILLIEYKFKKYKTLKKSFRKVLYRNADLIKQDFWRFFNANNEVLQAHLKQQNIPVEKHEDEKLLLLFGIMQYLLPKLKYRPGSAFEKLLRNPKNEKLIGDCNQIVTLYLALYSLKYSVNDVQLKLTPGHVCLHYRGIDIETTTGKFEHYQKHDGLLDTEEIISINLLDISDQDEARYEISPKKMLEAAGLAYIFSSHRSLVEKNLHVAYHNLGVHYMREHNFSEAEICFQKNKDSKNLQSCYENAVSYFLQQKKYFQAEKYALKSKDHKLKKIVIQHQAVDLLNYKKFNAARSKFRQISNQNGLRSCDQNELHYLYQKIKHCRTSADYKRNKRTIRQMLDLAESLKKQDVVRFCNDVLAE